MFPSSQTGPFLQDNSQLLCLDTILEQIKQMSARLNQVSTTFFYFSAFTDRTLRQDSSEHEDELSASELELRKTNKKLLLEGAAAFNLKPKVGLKFLEENGVIYSDPKMSREESLARFFKTTPRLDKKLLGDFISRPDQLEVSRAFMGLMEFNGVSLLFLWRRGKRLMIFDYRKLFVTR